MPGIRLLIVSPSPVFLHAAARMLRGHDGVAEVTTVQTASEALELMKRGKAEVVCLDEWLPGARIKQVVGDLKTLQRSFRIMWMTMEDSEVYRNAATILGVDGVLNKRQFTAEMQTFLVAATKEKPHVENFPRRI